MAEVIAILTTTVDECHRRNDEKALNQPSQGVDRSGADWREILSLMPRAVATRKVTNQEYVVWARNVVIVGQRDDLWSMRRVIGGINKSLPTWAHDWCWFDQLWSNPERMSVNIAWVVAARTVQCDNDSILKKHIDTVHPSVATESEEIGEKRDYDAVQVVDLATNRSFTLKKETTTQAEGTEGATARHYRPDADVLIGIQDSIQETRVTALAIDLLTHQGIAHGLQ
jgi:hypothetical protein